MTKDKVITEHIGTPAYLAPEIIKEEGYKNFQADIWSLGVMSFIALTGTVPFKGDDIDELNQCILNKELDFNNLKIKTSIKVKFLL